MCLNGTPNATYYQSSICSDTRLTLVGTSAYRCSNYRRITAVPVQTGEQSDLVIFRLQIFFFEYFVSSTQRVKAS